MSTVLPQTVEPILTVTRLNLTKLVELADTEASEDTDTSILLQI